MSVQTTITPHNQQPYVSRNYPSEKEIQEAIADAVKAQKEWKKVPLKERVEIGRKFVKEFESIKDEIPMELTLQMGRPISQTPGEMRGLAERANYMLDIAENSLKDITQEDTDKEGFRRYIKRTPLGVVFVIAPWNFPYLTSINSVLPALVAGNAVLLKPSPQTPLTAERMVQAFEKAGVPSGVIKVLHLTPDLTSFVVQHPKVDFVSFTGSVINGKAVAEAAVKGGGFMGVALELGGKDPAYVAPDADLDYTAGELVDGAMFNSGQSCCAIERVYVHEKVYDELVEKVVKVVKGYKLGDPTLSDTNLGPVVSLASAERIRKQVADAVKQGAKALIPEDLFPAAKVGTTYVAPQVLVEVNHSMEVMMEETFGPVIGIQKVSSEDEAIALMNDSPYGLTASVWTNVQSNPESERLFEKFVEELETGTVFLNRCDYLDPALAWTGVKDSGRGVSLSKYGYDQLTRAKSVNMKVKTK
ncbi:succinate semialdehyde dehydrogenase [Coprinopsis sp. MPI-PUGE-AT-0042]|nr:succinate semialdehyde dehydrogenase [Coprinopsis sp. MPI-PUGE-AT-0042]